MKSLTESAMSCVLRDVPQKWLVVGSGRIARRHVEEIRRLIPESKFLRMTTSGASAVDPTIDDLTEAVVGDWAAALNWKPDAAVIANAASSHMSALTHLSRAGVASLVEKPLAMSLQEIDDFCQLAGDSPVPVMVGYCLRFHPVVVRIRELLRLGAIGVPIQFSFHVGQHVADWRPSPSAGSVSLLPHLGGGVVRELSHEIDLAVEFVGDIESVSASLGFIPDWEVEACANILLRGRLASASIVMNMLERPAKRSVTAVGTSGSIKGDLLEGSVIIQSGESGSIKELVGTGEQMYRLQIQYFIDCLVNGVSPTPGLTEGAQVVGVIEEVLARSEFN